MKRFDINDDEQVLLIADFDFFYNCKSCSRELCSFYNDILLINSSNFNKRKALADLVRIANSLNTQSELIEILTKKGDLK